MTQVIALIVKELGTNKEVHRVDVKGHSENYIERCMMGMMMNMDLEKYYVDEEAK